VAWLQDCRLTSAASIVQQAALQQQLLDSQAFLAALRVIAHHALACMHLHDAAATATGGFHEPSPSESLELPQPPALSAVQWRIIEEHKALSMERGQGPQRLALEPHSLHGGALRECGASCVDMESPDLHQLASAGDAPAHGPAVSSASACHPDRQPGAALQGPERVPSERHASTSELESRLRRPSWGARRLKQTLLQGSKLEQARALTHYLHHLDLQMLPQGAVRLTALSLVAVTCSAL
jgi:hypothetical protein